MCSSNACIASQLRSSSGCALHVLSAMSYLPRCNTIILSMISGGGGNCTRVPISATNSATCSYGNHSCRWSEMGREAESLREVIASKPGVPPHIIQAILALVRTAQG
jgi:hypothetical protein